LKQLAKLEGLQSRKLVADEEVERQRVKAAEARLRVVDATRTGRLVSDASKQYAEAVLQYELNQLARLEALQKSGAVAQDEVERQRVKVAQARVAVAQATAGQQAQTAGGAMPAARAESAEGFSTVAPPTSADAAPAERRETLRQLVKAAEKRYRSGNTTLDSVIRASDLPFSLSTMDAPETDLTPIAGACSTAISINWRAPTPDTWTTSSPGTVRITNGAWKASAVVPVWALSSGNSSSRSTSQPSRA
jgi:hypothetical protein